MRSMAVAKEMSRECIHIHIETWIHMDCDSDRARQCQITHQYVVPYIHTQDLDAMLAARGGSRLLASASIDVEVFWILRAMLCADKYRRACFFMHAYPHV